MNLNFLVSAVIFAALILIGALKITAVVTLKDKLCETV